MKEELIEGPMHSMRLLRRPSVMRAFLPELRSAVGNAPGGAVRLFTLSCTVGSVAAARHKLRDRLCAGYARIERRCAQMVVLHDNTHTRCEITSSSMLTKSRPHLHSVNIQHIRFRA